MAPAAPTVPPGLATSLSECVGVVPRCPQRSAALPNRGPGVLPCAAPRGTARHAATASSALTLAVTLPWCWPRVITVPAAPPAARRMQGGPHGCKRRQQGHLQQQGRHSENTQHRARRAVCCSRLEPHVPSPARPVPKHSAHARRRPGCSQGCCRWCPGLPGSRDQ